MESVNNNEHNDSLKEEPIVPKNEKLSRSPSDRSEKSLRTQQAEKARKEKIEAIRRACTSRDLEALISHAINEGGLLEDELRQVACKWCYSFLI